MRKELIRIDLENNDIIYYKFIKMAQQSNIKPCDGVKR